MEPASLAVTSHTLSCSECETRTLHRAACQCRECEQRDRSSAACNTPLSASVQTSAATGDTEDERCCCCCYCFSFVLMEICTGDP